MLSPQGELQHSLDTDCGLPDAGIAFASGYAFVGCEGAGDNVAVIDMDTMETVKILEDVGPDRRADGSSRWVALVGVEEVAGVVLLLGKGFAPRDYDSVTHTRSGVAVIAMLDPQTLEVVDYKAELPPGSRIVDVIEVDGMAWLLNMWSHIPERPPRADIYVMDPRTLEIVDSFNLSRPHPLWGRVGDDGLVFIAHGTSYQAYAAARRPGVTRVDPVTREETYWRIDPPLHSTRDQRIRRVRG